MLAPAQGFEASTIDIGGGVGGGTANTILYVDGSGNLASEAAFGYNETTNTLTLTETAGVKTFSFVHNGTNGAITVSSGSVNIAGNIGFIISGSISSWTWAANGGLTPGFLAAGLDMNNQQLANVSSVTSSGNTGILVTQAAAASGALPLVTWTSAAHTNQTASTEINSINFNLSATRQWATGALTTNREFLIQGPTYGFVGASTLTTGVTFEVNGSPIAGTNATITTAITARFIGTSAAVAGNRYALNVSGTWSDGGTTSTTLAYAQVIDPTFNYSAASKTGGIRGLYIAPTLTSMPTGASGVNGAIVLSSAAAGIVGTGLGGIGLFNTANETNAYEIGQIHWNSNFLQIRTLQSGANNRPMLFTATNLASFSIGEATVSIASWGINTLGRLAPSGNNGFYHGTSALATNATEGFLFIQSCAGTPAGTPASIPTGQKALIYDSTNNILYLYDGSWKKPSASIVTGAITWA